jgi:hypothetical protein
MNNNISETPASLLDKFRNRTDNLTAARTAERGHGMANLDEIDRRLLAELQQEGRITNVELAQRVGLTAPPCLSWGSPSPCLLWSA